MYPQQIYFNLNKYYSDLGYTMAYISLGYSRMMELFLQIVCNTRL